MHVLDLPPMDKSVWMGLTDLHLQEHPENSEILQQAGAVAPVRSCPSTSSFCLGRCSLLAECWSWEEDAVLPAWLSIPHSSGLTPLSPSPGRLLGYGSPLPPWPKAWNAAGGISELFVLRVKVLATGWDRPEYPKWAGVRCWILQRRWFLGTAVLMVLLLGLGARSPWVCDSCCLQR